MKKSSIAFILLGIFASSAYAGRPIAEEQTCPIGGEVFETTATASCSTMGNTMSLRSITSCDFVTILPVCPSNALPVYKEFTDADKQEIKEIMASPAYADAKSEDKYYRAYLIDSQISSGNVKAQYFTLQNGIWYGDADKTIHNDAYMAAYHDAADKYLDSVKTEDDAAFYMGGQAFAYYLSGDTGAAMAKLKAAKALAKGDNIYRDKYYKALNNCFSGKANAGLCTANTPLRAHDEKTTK